VGLAQLLIDHALQAFRHAVALFAESVLKR
jgi:hypothetical protein